MVKLLPSCDCDTCLCPARADVVHSSQKRMTVHICIRQIPKWIEASTDNSRATVRHCTVLHCIVLRELHRSSEQTSSSHSRRWRETVQSQVMREQLKNINALRSRSSNFTYSSGFYAHVLRGFLLRNAKFVCMQA